MSQAGLSERPQRRKLTKRECSVYLDQIQSSLRTMQLPTRFGDGRENSFLSVHVSMTISVASQEAWAFTYRIDQPIVVVADVPAMVHNSPPAVAPPSPPPSPPLAPLPDPIVNPYRERTTPPYGCNICLSEYVAVVNRVRCLKCSHMICRSCAKKCVNEKCPFCRYKNGHWPHDHDDDEVDFSDD